MAAPVRPSPPWDLQSGALVGALVYFVALAGLTMAAWWLAARFGWARGAWAWWSWSLHAWDSPSHVATVRRLGSWWLWSLRGSSALSICAPLPLAVWIGILAARPTSPAEVQFAGRRLSESVDEAAEEMEGEFANRSTPGVMIHPSVQISQDRETKHLVVCGMTGAGKTVFFKPVMQQAIDRGDRVLVFDNKGDFTKILRSPGGKRPIILAPWDRRCVAWDVAADCPGPVDCRTLAARIIRREEKADPQWTDGARAIVTASLLHLQKTKGRNWDLADLLRQVSVPYDELREVIREMAPESFQMVETNSKTLASYRSIVSTATANIRDMASGWEGRAKFSFRRWLLDPSSKEYRSKSARLVIIQGDGGFQELQRAYVQAIIGALGSLVNSPRLPESRERKVWLFLDEFPQLQKLTEISQFLEIGRSKGVRIVLGVQNVAQLRDLYGIHGAESWTSMVGTYWIGRTPGVDTPQWLSHMVGTRKVRRYKPTFSSDTSNGGRSPQRTDSWDEIEEPVIRAEELATTLGPGDDGVTGILYTGNERVYRLVWPYVDDQEYRPGVQYAPWTEAPVTTSTSVAPEEAAEESDTEKLETLPQPLPATVPSTVPATSLEPIQILEDAQPADMLPALPETLEPADLAPELPELAEAPADQAAEGIQEQAAAHLLDVLAPGVGMALEAVAAVAQAADTAQSFAPGPAGSGISAPVNTDPASPIIDLLAALELSEEVEKEDEAC